MFRDNGLKEFIHQIRERDMDRKVKLTATVHGAG
jgi:hypothetical protein